MDLPEPVKKYWPYMLGGVVGIIVIMKVSGGSSSGTVSTPAVDNTAANIAQRNLDIAAAQAQQQGNTNALLAQGQVAGQVGNAAAMVINQLNQPSVAAINAAAAENIQTTSGAVAAAMAGYGAQVNAASVAAQGASSIAQGFSNSSAALSNAISTANSSIGYQPYRAQMQTTGDSYATTGSVITTLGMAAISDESVKVNIAPTEEDSLSLISQIEFVSFDYSDPKYGDAYPVGAIAQRLQEINPAWVGTMPDGLLYIKPQFMMSIAHAQKQLNAKVKAIREHQNGTV